MIQNTELKYLKYVVPWHEPPQNVYLNFIFHLFFRRACRKYPNNKCLGTRELLAEEDEIQPNGRIFKKVILGKYIWLTYMQTAEKVRHFGSGLMAAGLKPKQNVLIFAETKADWFIAAQACFLYNFPGRLGSIKNFNRRL